jgi:hypothetical protein
LSNTSSTHAIYSVIKLISVGCFFNYKSLGLRIRIHTANTKLRQWFYSILIFYYYFFSRWAFMVKANVTYHRAPIIANFPAILFELNLANFSFVFIYLSIHCCIFYKSLTLIRSLGFHRKYKFVYVHWRKRQQWVERIDLKLWSPRIYVWWKWFSKK